jgi:hypothetical protein
MWMLLVLSALVFWVERLRNLQPLILHFTPRGLLRVVRTGTITPAISWIIRRWSRCIFRGGKTRRMGGQLAFDHLDTVGETQPVRVNVIGQRGLVHEFAHAVMR